MSELPSEIDPDWDTELHLSLTPSMIIDTMFYTADTVHTGHESCIDPSLVLVDIVATDERSDTNYCRFVEQRYTDENENDGTWQDWAVELSLAGTFITAHWRIQVPGSPADWEWGVKEAEKAFKAAAILIGRRVRSAIAVEEPTYPPPPTRTRH